MVPQAALALALLYGGGELLVAGASSLALRLGLSTLAVGLTVVAFGTSLPELVVSVDAALAGVHDISTGNVVGSNIANVALILGLAALIGPMRVESKIVRIDVPIMVVASLGAVAVLADGRISRVEGVGLLAALVAYTGFTFWETRRESDAVRDELATAAPTRTRGPLGSVIRILGGLALLVAGGHLLVDAAVGLASSFGLGEAAIGLTLVAVGTSLPELATSVVASVRGRGDIAVGNVVGSNIFNVLGILGATAVIQPLGLGHIRAADLGVMVGLAVLLQGVILVRPRLGRVVGAILLAGYVAYTASLLRAGT
jgi:cation:H+ antiporter